MPRSPGTFFTGIWLLYLVGGVADLVSHHYGAPYVAGGLAIIVAFCLLYLVLVPTWPTPSRYKLPGLAALALLAVVFCLFYGQTGAVGLWIFVSSASGLLLANRGWALRAVLGCVICYLVFSLTTHVHGTDFLSNVLPAVFIGLAMIGLRHQVELTAQLSQAREEVAQLAASEERLRLARDMHDLTGQSLSMITLKSELAARLLGRLPQSGPTGPGQGRDRAGRGGQQADAAGHPRGDQRVPAADPGRRDHHRPRRLGQRGHRRLDDAELTLLSGTFDPDAEAPLAWCLREAVTNVVRHSGATNCHISLAQRGGTMSLTVRDDGTGHIPRPPAAAGDQAGAAGPAGDRRPVPEGSGLRGMSERLSAVGGTLELRPDARPGFCLIATVPTTVAAGAQSPGAGGHPASARNSDALSS